MSPCSAPESAPGAGRERLRLSLPCRLGWRGGVGAQSNSLPEAAGQPSVVEAQRRMREVRELHGEGAFDMSWEGRLGPQLVHIGWERPCQKGENKDEARRHGPGL